MVPKMLQYREYIQNPSPNEGKWRRFNLGRYSSGIFFQNTFPVENYEDHLMLTKNPGCKGANIFKNKQVKK
jgi:hypothetical protein